MSDLSVSPSEKIFFAHLREDRGWYYVEYQPPQPGYRFGMMNIVVPGPSQPSDVAEAMETELEWWLKRFPVPLMVSAFDEKGDLYQLEEIRASNLLMGYMDKMGNKVSKFWRVLSDDEIPGDPYNNKSLLGIYPGIQYKTATHLRQQAETQTHQMQIGWVMVFFWAVIVPVSWALLEWAGPAWIGTAVLVLSLGKASVKGLKLSGKLKDSPREIQAEEEERQMRHHHYHCKRNPKLFLRLKLENFEQEERERIRNEAKSLK